LSKHNKMAAKSRAFSVRAKWAHCSRNARQDCDKDLWFFK
jgi:hypothetical protein